MSLPTVIPPSADLAPVILAQRVRPFSLERKVVELPAGLTLAEMIELSEPDPIMREICVARIGDWTITRDRWHRVRPKPGSFVLVVPVPQGGTDVLRTVLTIAVVATAMAVMGPVGLALGGGALGAFGAGIAASAISVAGMLAINALCPPAQPQLEGGRTKDSPTYSLEGGGNRARLWEAIPRLVGRHKMYPDLVAPWVSENRGDDVYLNGLLCWGYGPVQVSELKIGETPIGNFQGVEIQHSVGIPGEVAWLPLYPSTITPEKVETQLTRGVGFVSRTTAPDSHGVILDFQMPRGGIKYGKKTGDRIGISVDFEIDYRRVGNNTWTSTPSFRISSKTTSVVRRSVTIDFPERGQYEVRVRRLSEDNDDEQTFTETWWAQLKSVDRTNPVLKAGLALTAIKIKASEQLSGTIDDLNGIAEAVVQTWYPSRPGWDMATTSNPANLFRAVLQGNGCKKPIPDEQLDWAAVEEWANWCGGAGFTCNFVFDKQMSTWEALQLVASCGRAAPSGATGRWQPVIDREKPFPVQMFSPRNMRSFSGRRIWVDLPHALKISFVDETSGYEQKQRIVYADGFHAGNATKFEDLELPGLTHPDLVYRYGRFHLAEAVLRPETYQCEVDFEHMVCTRGDLVQVAHDATLWGTTWGRITAIRPNAAGTHVGEIDLDEVMALQPERVYVLRVRGLDTQTVLSITHVVFGKTLIVTSLHPLAGLPFGVGDLAIVGEQSRETFQLLVQGITPGPDLSARLNLIPYSPGVFRADVESIPAWDPGITRPVGSQVPIISSIRSGELVGKRMADGSILTLVLVSLFDDGSRPTTTIAAVDMRWSVKDSGSPWRYISAPREAREITINEAEDGQTILVACRYRFTSGRDGAWTPEIEHEVEAPDIPPFDVESIFFDGDNIAWSYPVFPPDLDGFVLRYGMKPGMKWDDAVPVTDGVIPTTSYPAASLPQGAKEVMVKAVTVAGILSEKERRLEIDEEFNLDLVRFATLDFKAEFWPGTITGGAIQPNNTLRANDTSLWNDPGNARWLSPADGPWLDPAWTDIEWRTQWTAPHRMKSTDRLSVEYSGSGVIEVYYRRTQDTLEFIDETTPIPDNLLAQDDELPLGAFFEGDSRYPWIPWRQAVRVGNAETLEILVRVRTVPTTIENPAASLFVAGLFEAGLFAVVTESTGDPEVTPTLETFKVYANAVEVIDIIPSHSLPPGGGRLPLTKTFRGVRYINATLHATTIGAAVIKVEDFAADGPKVAAYAPDDAPIAATATFQVGGW